MIYLIYRYKVGILLSMIIWAGLVWLLGWNGVLLLLGAIFLALIGYVIWASVHQPRDRGNLLLFYLRRPSEDGRVEKHEELRKLSAEDQLQARPQLTPEEAKKLINDF